MNIKDEEVNVASATECTGLMPTVPEDEEEKDSYKSLIRPLPKKRRK